MRNFRRLEKIDRIKKLLGSSNGKVPLSVYIVRPPIWFTKNKIVRPMYIYFLVNKKEFTHSGVIGP